MTANPYFSTYSRLPRDQTARAEAVNAIIDAIIVGFDSVPNALALSNAAAIAAAALATVSQWAVIGGINPNALTATYTIPVTSLTNGLLLCFRANLTNTSSVPTFQADATTARTITRSGGLTLNPGDIQVNGEYVARYNLANTRWELLNPSLPLLNRYVNFGGFSPANTSSAVAVMMGLGGSFAIVPRLTARVRIRLMGYVTNVTAAQQASLNMRYGTGAAPANGAAATGTALLTIGAEIMPNNAGGMPTQWVMESEVGSLSIGTPYWFDGTYSTTGGALITRVSSVIIEEI